MELILKEDVPKLGSKGDVVKVAEGFGRNSVPQKLAILANKGNKAVIEQMKAAGVRRSAKEKSPGGRVGETVRWTFGFILPRKWGENDQLFGSVTSGDIAEAWTRKGHDVDRRKIQLHEPLKTLGDYDVPDQVAQGCDGAREGRHRKRSRRVRNI